MCGEITPQNYKYIYTLSLENRKNILKHYNITNKLLKKSSIEIFYDLVNFLIKEPKNVFHQMKNLKNIVWIISVNLLFQLVKEQKNCIISIL